MQALGNYLLRIVAAALLLGAAGQLVRGKRGKQMLRLCGGLCMALVVLAPLPGLASVYGRKERKLGSHSGESGEKAAPG